MTLAQRPHRDWGPWVLDAGTLPVSLDHDFYEVDLERCLTSAQVLDVVAQVAGKVWADDATLAGLVRALVDVLHPQAHLCSSGQSKQLTVAQVRTRACDFHRKEKTR